MDIKHIVAFRDEALFSPEALPAGYLKKKKKITTTAGKNLVLLQTFQPGQLLAATFVFVCFVKCSRWLVETESGWGRFWSRRLKI